MRALKLAVTAVILAACTKSGTPAGDTSNAGASTTASNDTTSPSAAVAQVRDAWADGAHNQDTARVAALYTSDAVMVGSDQPLASGREAIQAALGKSFPIAHGLKLNSENSDVSGDLAYDFGTYSEELTPPKGKSTIVGGAYLVVLKKQPDGSWKITHHVTATPPKG